MLDSYQLDPPFRYYKFVCDLVIFKQYLQWKKPDSLWPIFQKLVHAMTKYHELPEDLDFLTKVQTF